MSTPKEGSITKKRVSWKENLTTSVPIEGKVIISKDMQEEVLAMIGVFKQFLPIQMQRTRFVELDQLIHNYERISKRKFSERTFQTIVSLKKSSFQPVTLDKKLYIDISDGNIIEDIIKTKINQLLEDCVPYIDLIPLRESKKYQSAQDILKENIEKFSDDNIESDEEAADDKNLPIMERLSKKVEKKNEIKRKRSMKMEAKKPGWQRDRLPMLARIVNKIFVSKERNLMKTEEIIERIVQSEYRSMDIKGDFKKLMKITDGWLTDINGFIKRRPEDLNHIVYLIRK